MISYLDFKDARCKDCYKCLRECPVKAIKVVNHQAKIIDERCILCGKCTEVCTQNAKRVHSEIDEIKQLLKKHKVIASVAPSFISGFDVNSFETFKLALGKLGFDLAEETAVGAKLVTDEYRKLLESNKLKNLISSACPAVNRMIQLYYSDALSFLAPVDSPMIAHAKIIKNKYPDHKIVFIGPCIAKKREARECGLIDGVLTFEDLEILFKEKNIILSEIAEIEGLGVQQKNSARFYPISRGIIKSFDNYVDGYEFVAVDGVEKVSEVLSNISELSGMFLELSGCEYSCVNGPCSLIKKGTAVKANGDIRNYTNIKSGCEEVSIAKGINTFNNYKRIKPKMYIPSESEINEVLAQTGKLKLEDELNCGVCGYATCREKAIAVLNGYAEVDMCLPFMRERAESMSYEIIQNSPNGIVLLGYDLKIFEINKKAKEIWGISDFENVKGKDVFDFFNPTEFLLAINSGTNLSKHRIYIDKTDKYVDLDINLLERQKMVFAVMKDITTQINSEERFSEIRLKTIETTDEVIKKQMRVAQEIASLLGETTAETKVALLKLKQTLQEENLKE